MGTKGERLIDRADWQRKADKEDRLLEQIAETEFDVWCAKLSKRLWYDALDMDADDCIDGYSIEDAFDRYDSGDTPEQYARRVLIRQGRCIRCGSQEVRRENIRHDHCSECRDNRER
jgi:hypothetical protein